MTSLPDAAAGETDATLRPLLFFIASPDFMQCVTYA
jgi:hypothetical protein